jgi:deoxycytidylate deaminase
VIGVSGRIGSGVSFVRDKVLQSLRTFEYHVDIIDVTEMMDKAKKALGDAEVERIDNEVANIEEIKGNSRAQRIRRFQLIGNSFRWCFGNSILAALSVAEFIIPDLSGIGNGLVSRRAYIIDSLKHPAEVSLLRQLFGNLFWHIGVVAGDRTRLNRLEQRKNCSPQAFEYLSDEDASGKDLRDEDGKRQNGQRSIDAVLEADYFFANDYSTKDEIESEAARLTRLIFGIQVVSPTKDEVGMNAAQQASLRSACLSRQVGAAILAKSGELLSTGHNDVPKFRGGLYGSVPAEQDKRCWAWGAKCYNDVEKGKITTELVEILIKNGVIDEGRRTDVIKILTASRIKGLIEFSRAVHAEMEALISIARLGIGGLVNSTLYTTTYPCHNCAKHIVDAGVERVVYLEPYEKSLARLLHADAIMDPLHENSESKVRFDNYGGVAPRRFDEAFTPFMERKRDGVFNDQDRLRQDMVPARRTESAVIQQRLVDLQGWVDARLAPDDTIVGGISE